ncbi:MAG: RIP metalloprotease RseP [Hyphomicrobiales bacterium]|nr:RIP metalloprotease RseP [Hyphomicrobiales bacterium]
MDFDFLTDGLAWAWSVLRYPVAFLFVLTVVVFFHELGHFLVARWYGVKVLVFSIGFGPELFGFNDRHGTRWKLSAIPLGGYVKFFGDENAASVPDQSAVAAMSEAERRISFVHQKVGPRAAVVVAGPLANFILAILIFAGLFMVMGKQYTKPRIDFVQPGSAAAVAGFQKGDLVLSVDGRSIESFLEVERIIATNPGRPLEFLLERNGKRVAVMATPELREERDRFRNVNRMGRLDIGGPVIRARVGSIQPGSAAAAAGLAVDDVIEAINGKPVETFTDVRNIVVESPGKPLNLRIRRGERTMTIVATPATQTAKRADGSSHSIGILGISGSFDPEDVRLIHYGPIAALGLGAAEMWSVIDQTFTYIQGVFAGRAPADQLGGPIMIAQVSGQVASVSFAALLQLAGVLSVSIGLLNLFPVPLLDGGHLLYYLIEAVRGRPLSERAQEFGFRIGMALVLMLMVFATYNDIGRLASTFWPRS